MMMTMTAMTMVLMMQYDDDGNDGANVTMVG